VIRLLRTKPFARALLLRGAAAWWAVRALAAFGGIWELNLLQAAFVTACAGLLVLFDACRRGEDLFLGNVGVPLVALVAVGALPALVAEIVLAVAL
jgi:hypothetical protein